jgi:hypothetical protein
MVNYIVKCVVIETVSRLINKIILILWRIIMIINKNCLVVKIFVVLILLLINFGCNEFSDPNAEANIPKILISEEITISKFEPKIEKEIITPDIIEWIYKSSNLPKSTAKEISIFIYENCKYPHLIHGIIMKESNFKIFSHRKDTKVYGLGQITYEIWKDEIKQFDILEARDLYDWRKNILATDYIFNKYYEETGDLRDALKKYVGQVNNDVSKYCSDILAHVGYLYIIEKNNS